MNEVAICNLALSHIGDTAEVMSIKPPDSSVQAQLCARFYPAARDALLEMSSWGFATLRVQLAAVTLPTYTDSNGNTVPGSWLYGYAVPSDMVNALAVLPAEAVDDYEVSFGLAQSAYPPYPQGYVPGPNSPVYTPQPFALETQKDGTSVLLTNVPDAVLRYTRIVTDSSQFSPLATVALSHLLASFLAGPILKGDAGIAESAAQLKIFQAFLALATSSDANQHKTNVEASVSWIRGR
jgi:hypothetical protein